MYVTKQARSQRAFFWFRYYLTHWTFFFPIQQTKTMYCVTPVDTFVLQFYTYHIWIQSKHQHKNWSFHWVHNVFEEFTSRSCTFENWTITCRQSTTTNRQQKVHEWVFQIEVQWVVNSGGTEVLLVTQSELHLWQCLTIIILITLIRLKDR